jgi:hypothetical protein
MTVAKGVWNPETGYEYTCGKCHGTGDWHGYLCDHCYGVLQPDAQWNAIMSAFKTAKGERYYALWKAALSLRGKEIVDAVLEIKAERGKVTIADIFHLMVKFDWPRMRAKPFFEWLEETTMLPTGTYDNMKERGFVIKTACEKLGISLE